jgi:MFS family permease
VVGPLAAYGLIALGASLPRVFLISTVPALVACLVVGFWVREPSRETIVLAGRAPVEAKVTATTPPAPTARLLRRPFVAYLAAVSLFSLGGSADAFLILRAHDAGLSTAQIPLLWAFHNGLKALATAKGGALADRFGRRRAVAAGWLVYALVYAGFALSTSLLSIVALFALYALYYALAGGAQKALVADLVPAVMRARGYGAYHLCVGVMLLPASAIFGVVYQQLGAPVAFACGAGLALAAVALLPLSRAA